MSALTDFHAHVYFEPSDRTRAVDLRREIDRRFGLPVGRVHDRPVGPHVRGMFQVLFDSARFGTFVPWLMQHRQGLSVLIHGESGDDYRDHTEHAFWLGEPLALDLSIFRPARAPLSPS